MRSHRTALFGLYSVCLLAVSADVLRALIRLAKEDASASHTILVPLIVLVLVFQRRDSIFSSAQSFDRGGFVVGAGGLALLSAAWLLKGLDSWLSIAVAGVVVLWVGGFLFFYGRTALRAASFPLLFLGFMIPIPSVVLDPVTDVLKAGSAKTVAALFTVTGTPFYRDGFVFALPKFVIQIADECSGIRSSIALLLTSVLAGDIYLGKARSKALLVATVLPLAVLKNGIRIVALCLLATHVDPSFLTGELHHEGGFAFFVLVLPLLALIVLVLRRFEHAVQVTQAETRIPKGTRGGDSLIRGLAGQVE